jgi:dTDP-glucose 4,6-dehydratase
VKVVYITGCLGFIGAYVTRECLNKGWLVYGIDKCTYAADPSLLDEFNQYDNFRFEKKDIKEISTLKDCDYVINIAAESHVGNSIIDSEVFINSNVVGVQNLLELIRQKPENCFRRPVFLHFSTDEVYGDIIDGEHFETDILKPSNPYSASKACADMLIFAWARTYGIEYNIIRPTNNYGIGQYPEKLIPLSIKNLQRNRKIRLHNGGTPIRNWLHAADTAAAVVAIIESGQTNEIYNVAGGFGQKNITTVSKIIENYYKDAMPYSDWKELIDFSYSREGQDVRYALNDDKLRQIGWAPTKIFDEEIVKIVNFYRNKIIW